MPTLPRALSILLSLGLLALMASMLRRRKLREKYVALWIVVGLAATVLSIWPAALVSISNSLGFQVPSNFLFFVDGILLLLVSIQLSAEVSKLEDRTEVIAQELAIISMRLASAQKRHPGGDAEPEPTPRPDQSSSLELKQGQSGLASVRLKDGRILRLQDIVAAPRPGVVLIAKSVYLPHANTASHITLVDSNELPQHAQLTFSVRAKWPTVFYRDEMIEVATADGSYSTTLSLTNGGITLESQSVAIATLDPARVFGPSAFGPLRFRVIDAGVKGDWQSLVTLVRLPQLHKLVCPATAKLACKLTGTDLFLVAALANNAAFEHPVEVPDGFPGYALPVPHPKDGKLYVKLRDDPQVINLASIAARHLPPGPALLGDVPRGSAVANTALHNAPKGARAVPVVVPVARRSTPAAHPAPAPAGSAAAPSTAAISGPEVAKKSAPHGPVSAPAPQEAVAHAPGSNPAAPVAPAPTAVPAATPKTSASPVAGSGTTHTRQPPQG